MSKFASSGFLQAGFGLFKNASGNVTQTLCSGQPAAYADIASLKLASVVLSKTSDITIAAGDVSGWKMTIAAKSAVSVTTSGTGNHVVVDDGTNFFVTTTTSTAVAAGGTVDMGSWQDEARQPV
jgi:hypothetical protein